MIKHSAGLKTQYHELAARFERIRDLLLTDRSDPRLKLPLAHWALPADRRLPRALMHRTLGDLLQTSFASLSATPGIGQKKVHSLLQLLDRALRGDEFPEDDPTNISEVTWARWCAVIMEHGIGDQPLGRFAADLHELPRVIWRATLASYAALTLDEIRRLKTHGEKRVQAITAIFGKLQATLVERGPAGLIDVAPRSIDALDAWTTEVVAGKRPLTLDELRARLLMPLVEQIRLDAGDATAELVLGRLGWDGPKLSVRRAAMKLRLTRARIYQLLEDAETVAAVRWPQGLEQMRGLLARSAEFGQTSDEHTLMKAAAEVFFATTYRPAIMPPPAFLRRNEMPLPPVPGWQPMPVPALAVG
jgi:hypothetical protein